MAGAWIKRRQTQPNPETGRTSDRFYVYYSWGGRVGRQRYAGAFKTKKDAEVRKSAVLARLAAGQTVEIAEWLESLKQPYEPPRRPGLADAYTAFTASRMDVSQATQDLYRNSRDKILPILGHTTDPATLTVADMQRLINTMAEKMAVNSIKQYVGTLRQVLAYIDIEPNPLKSPKLRYPREEVEEIQPPTTAEWKAVQARISSRYRLFARLLECCGLRIGEGLELRWGDIDWVNSRLRVSVARTKTRSGQRWLPVPESLLDEIARLEPEEDRILASRVFSMFGESGFRGGLARAVKTAGVPYFHPHDLRHRRISLWFAHGIDEVQIARWSGHANASMSQDVYGHVLIDARDDEWLNFWSARYGRPGGASVGHAEEVF